jgi:putative ABC transport system permease protein
VSLLTGILFGIMPALRASSENLAKDLSPSRKTTGSKASVRLRSALVVGQVGLSLVLLVGSGMLIRSFARQSSSHPGFDPRHVLTGMIDLPEDRYPNADRCNQFLEALKAEIEALPGVSSMSYISHLPVLHPFSDLAAWASDAPPALLAEREMAYRRAVLPGYFQTLRIPILAGRDFTSADLYSKTPLMIVSQHMAKSLFPGRNPLGQHVMLDQENGAVACEVVGVVGDVAIRTFGEAPARAMYIPNRGNGGGGFVIRTTVDPESILQSVRKRVAARDRGLAIENLRSFEKRLARSMAPQKVSAITLSLFSAVALLLASLGLYGVLSYLVKLRTREIGIRTALGAQMGQVVWEITKHGLVLTAFGMGIGVLGSLALGRILASQLYKVSPADPLSMALGSLTLGFVAMVATLVPALQAARVNPVVALRDE